MKILLTGGHLSPALAVIDYLLNKKDTTILFIGRKYNLTHEKSYSLEYKEIVKRQIPFYHLSTGRMNRPATPAIIIELLKIPLAIIKAFILLRKEKPSIVLSFGGFIAFPVALATFFTGTPLFAHEQTIHPGLANRFVALFAKKIFISFPQTAAFFPKNKTILTGNPIRGGVFAVTKKPFRVTKDKPVIFITGGSLGSHSLNYLIGEILDRLLEDYIIIHQTGSVKEYDDYQRLLDKKSRLPLPLGNNYFLREHFFEDEMGYVYDLTDLVISRSGANILSELFALKKPAILVPLPWSAHKEQQKHANLFKKMGGGEIFNQNQSPLELLTLIRTMFGNISRYKQAFINLDTHYTRNATEAIVKTALSQS